MIRRLRRWLVELSVLGLPRPHHSTANRYWVRQVGPDSWVWTFYIAAIDMRIEHHVTREILAEWRKSIDATIGPAEAREPIPDAFLR